MSITDALIRQNNMNNLKRKNGSDDDDEPTQTYKEKNREWWSINQTKSAFVSSLEDGINSRESVFDKQAVFRTGER